jgi:hypothetical protein
MPLLVELVGIHSTEIDEYWPCVLPFVQSAVENAYDSADYVYERLKDRTSQLWTAQVDGEIEAICVTRLEVYEKGKTCGIWICTGTGRTEWQHHMPTIEAWARANGCIAMRHMARPGWARVLKPMGYEMTHVILEKDL